MTEDPASLATVAGGQIAIQTMLSVLVNLYIGECPDIDLARREITKLAEEMVDKASVPDLPATSQTPARDRAKRMVRDWIAGQTTH
jgi:hypothetical protein